MYQVVIHYHSPSELFEHASYPYASLEAARSIYSRWSLSLPTAAVSIALFDPAGECVHFHTLTRLIEA